MCILTPFEGVATRNMVHPIHNVSPTTTNAKPNKPRVNNDSLLSKPKY